MNTSCITRTRMSQAGRTAGAVGRVFADSAVWFGLAFHLVSCLTTVGARVGIADVAGLGYLALMPRTTGGAARVGRSLKTIRHRFVRSVATQRRAIAVIVHSPMVNPTARFVRRRATLISVDRVGR